MSFLSLYINFTKKNRWMQKIWKSLITENNLTEHWMNSYLNFQSVLKIIITNYSFKISKYKFYQNFILQHCINCINLIFSFKHNFLYYWQSSYIHLNVTEVNCFGPPHFKVIKFALVLTTGVILLWDISHLYSLRKHLSSLLWTLIALKLETKLNQLNIKRVSDKAYTNKNKSTMG